MFKNIVHDLNTEDFNGQEETYLKQRVGKKGEMSRITMLSSGLL